MHLLGLLVILAVLFWASYKLGGVPGVAVLCLALVGLGYWGWTSI